MNILAQLLAHPRRFELVNMKRHFKKQQDNYRTGALKWKDTVGLAEEKSGCTSPGKQRQALR